jgi:hypothetical protein
MLAGPLKRGVHRPASIPNIGRVKGNVEAWNERNSALFEFFFGCWSVEMTKIL